MTRVETISPAQVSEGPQGPHGGRPLRAKPVYAALDLGTNNCRLLIARPVPGGFRILDAFSRIVRLGEGLSGSGRLGEPAIARTIAEAHDGSLIATDRPDGQRGACLVLGLPAPTEEDDVE